MKTEYRQRLPHIQPIGATFFVTFRLFESIPVSALKEINEEYALELNRAEIIRDIQERNASIFNIRKKYIVEYEKILDCIKTGHHYLKQEDVMQLIKNELHRFDGTFYDLIAYSIMSNHVHILIDTSIQTSKNEMLIESKSQYVQLDTIMKRIKAPIARHANKLLNRSGQFWARESYDIYIRNEKMLVKVTSYILENPVKAGIVNAWDEYKGNYLKNDHYWRFKFNLKLNE